MVSTEIGNGPVVGAAALQSAPVSSLTRDFLTWVASRPRTYAEAMEVWRSTCPRLTIWEDALIDGFVQVGVGPMDRAVVTLTPRGRAILHGDESVAGPAGS